MKFFMDFVSRLNAYKFTFDLCMRKKLVYFMHFLVFHDPVKYIELFLTFLSYVSGLEIWCIENLQVVSVPKSSHGKFYSGSAYIVLNVSFSRFALFI